MSLFDQIKNRGDANGDGRVTKQDLDSFRNDQNSSKIDQLKEIADQNDDGKLSLDDIKNFDAGNMFQELKQLF